MLLRSIDEHLRSVERNLKGPTGYIAVGSSPPPTGSRGAPTSTARPPPESEVHGHGGDRPPRPPHHGGVIVDTSLFVRQETLAETVQQLQMEVEIEKTKRNARQREVLACLRAEIESAVQTATQEWSQRTQDIRLKVGALEDRLLEMHAVVAGRPPEPHTARGQGRGAIDAQTYQALLDRIEEVEDTVKRQRALYKERQPNQAMVEKAIDAKVECDIIPKLRLEAQSTARQAAQEQIRCRFASIEADLEHRVQLVRESVIEQGTQAASIAARLHDTQSGWQQTLTAMKEGVERKVCDIEGMVTTMREWKEAAEKRLHTVEAMGRTEFDRIQSSLMTRVGEVKQLLSHEQGDLEQRLAADIRNRITAGLATAVSMADIHNLGVPELRAELSSLARKERVLKEGLDEVKASVHNELEVRVQSLEGRADSAEASARVMSSRIDKVTSEMHTLATQHTTVAEKCRRAEKEAAAAASEVAAVSQGLQRVQELEEEVRKGRHRDAMATEGTVAVLQAKLERVEQSVQERMESLEERWKKMRSSDTANLESLMSALQSKVDRLQQSVLSSNAMQDAAKASVLEEYRDVSTKITKLDEAIKAESMHRESLSTTLLRRVGAVEQRAEEERHDERSNVQRLEERLRAGLQKIDQAETFYNAVEQLSGKYTAQAAKIDKLNEKVDRILTCPSEKVADAAVHSLSDRVSALEKKRVTWPSDEQAQGYAPVIEEMAAVLREHRERLEVLEEGLSADAVGKEDEAGLRKQIEALSHAVQHKLELLDAASQSQQLPPPKHMPQRSRGRPPIPTRRPDESSGYDTGTASEDVAHEELFRRICGLTGVAEETLCKVDELAARVTDLEKAVYSEEEEHRPVLDTERLLLHITRSCFNAIDTECTDKVEAERLVRELLNHDDMPADQLPPEAEQLVTYLQESAGQEFTLPKLEYVIHSYCTAIAKANVSRQSSLPCESVLHAIEQCQQQSDDLGPMLYDVSTTPSAITEDVASGSSKPQSSKAGITRLVKQDYDDDDFEF